MKQPEVRLPDRLEAAMTSAALAVLGALERRQEALEAMIPGVDRDTASLLWHEVRAVKHDIKRVRASLTTVSAVIAGTNQDTCGRCTDLDHDNTVRTSL